MSCRSQSSSCTEGRVREREREEEGRKEVGDRGKGGRKGEMEGK